MYQQFIYVKEEKVREGIYIWGEPERAPNTQETGSDVYI